MKICYTPKNFRAETLRIIELAESICQEYAGQQLTLRQLYYQFVARGYIPNKQTEYDRLGSIINDARLAGVFDWNYLQDRTRNLISPATWSTPGAIISSAADSYQLDLWEQQTYRPEVWIEKDAAIGTIEAVCARWRVPYFSCRGYTSQSEMWVTAQRLAHWRRQVYEPVIFHLGDHDPSGLDMTRDIRDRLAVFDIVADVRRLALNWDQVRRYNPPPNPTKLTDARAAGYLEKYGNESWELDALPPDVVEQLIERAIEGIVERPAWEELRQREETERAQLDRAASRWTEIAATLE